MGRGVVRRKGLQGGISASTRNNYLKKRNLFYSFITNNNLIIIKSTHGRGADLPFFCVLAEVQYWYK